MSQFWETFNILSYLIVLSTFSGLDGLGIHSPYFFPDSSKGSEGHNFSWFFPDSCWISMLFPLFIPDLHFCSRIPWLLPVLPDLSVTLWLLRGGYRILMDLVKILRAQRAKSKWATQVRMQLGSLRGHSPRRVQGQGPWKTLILLIFILYIDEQFFCFITRQILAR